MNQEIRNKLRNVVTQCRRLLEESVSEELEGKYAIFARKDKVTADPSAKMTHLIEEEREARKDILDHLGHIQARGFKPMDALDQLVREIAFTHLNRLCAYKMMEAREVYVGGQRFREAVSRGVNSNGVKFYLADHPEEERLFNTGHQDLAYRHFLDWLGGLLSEEIGVLFNPNDPANRLYPRRKILDEVLDLLNGGGIKPEEADLKEAWPKIWSQDETIGWVYQYFTPKELRDQARKESSAPRNSYELGFRNQFFTPRYVVEFLTDNTLGRIWYEMRKGETSLVQNCRNLIRRTHVVFLSEGQRPPEPFVSGEWQEAMDTKEMWTCPPGDEKDLGTIWHYALTVDGYEFSKEHCGRECGDLANERLQDYKETKKWKGSFQELRCCLFFEQRRWRHFGYDPEGEDLAAIFALFGAICERWNLELEFIQHRSKKDPRDLKVLDPACGSGHFLLYCFDLLCTIYEEAYSDADFGPVLKQDYETLEHLRRDVPRLILAHNLHGIDIDQRASQIAALALWLRCQRAYQEIGQKGDRSKITRSNLVCAEPMPGEDRLLAGFIVQLEPKFLGQVVEVVFDKMKLAGEAGPLLKIEEEIRDAVSAAKKQWIRETTRATDRKGQPLLFSQTAMDRLSGKPDQPPLFDLTDVTDDLFFEQAESKVIEALRQYAEKAQNGERLQRRLFVDDAVRGFSFVDICHKKFDAVLMNPPFGEASHSTATFIKQNYPSWNDNLLCAFLERAWDLLDVQGKAGAIYDRTALIKSTYEEFRRSHLIPDCRLEACADLGWEVLDANVEVTTSVLSRRVGCSNGTFIDVRSVPSKTKGEVIAAAVASLNSGSGESFVFSEDPSIFGSFPNAVIGYDFPLFLRRAFKSLPSLSASGIQAYTGHQLKAEKHFRLWWEISLLQRPKFLSRMFNGASYSPYTAPLLDCAIASSELEALPKDTSTVLRNKTKHYQPGVCFGKRGDFFCVHVLPAQHIFTVEGQSFPLAKEEAAIDLLGLLNTPLVRFSLNRFCGQHKYSGYVNLMPYRALNDPLRVRKAVLSVLTAFARARSFDETQSLFAVPDYGISVQFFASQISKGIETAGKASKDCESLCHSLSLEAYKVSSQESDALEQFRRSEPAPENAIEDADIDTGCRWFAAHAIVSHALGYLFGRLDIRFATQKQHQVVDLPLPFAPLPLCSPGMLQAVDGRPLTISPDDYAIRIEWDGILVDDPAGQNDIVRRVREVLGVIWKDREEVIEEEACSFLKVKDLRDYLRSPSKRGFWNDHLFRYSKNRRSAPIYWLLQSSQGNFGLWLYYHRLDKDLLFKALVNYVEPKIRLETSRLETLRSQSAAASELGKETKRLARELESHEDFLTELRDFEDKLRRAANLHLVPDLNDGVVLNIAPLWELVPWKEAKSYWEELLEGKYEWSSIGRQLRQKGLVK
ncbi:MAG: DNA methyltransferase [Terracidiphilus sp.]